MRIFFTAISLICILICKLPCTAQTITPDVEQKVEDLATAEQNDNIEDDSYLQQLEEYRSHPINLNTATGADLEELKLLTSLQISSIINYRILFGKFIEIYELQAIPALDIITINKMRPYVTVSDQENLLTSLKKRLHSGTQMLLFRLTQTPEKSKAYMHDSASVSGYNGSPQKILLRYRFVYKNSLSFGLLGEKDAGEQFFKGVQKQGFDFYSFHLFAKDLGIVKTIALGDFSVSLGQGLTEWQSFAFKKGADVLNVKRQSAVLKPYSSSGEINFNRGAGITVLKRHWEMTLFGSLRKLDANFQADSLLGNADYVSSLQSSGYHRTLNEIADKASQKALSYGGNLSWHYQRLHVGFNIVKHQYKLPIIKSDDPYNLYAVSGTKFGNYSIDYSYTFQNLHLFSEISTDNLQHKAVLAGMVLSLSATADMSLLYRNISPAYQSFFSNAFTENSAINNERGIYAGLSLHPNAVVSINAYVDVTKFPWLKYRVDKPSVGADYFFQIGYQPNKLFNIYTRFHSETKALNANPYELQLSPVSPLPKQQWKTVFNYNLNAVFSCKGQTESIWFANRQSMHEQGWMASFSFAFAPRLKSYEANAGVSHFETEGYNSRLYLYETDVLYSFSTPLLYGKGDRFYVGMNYKISHRIRMSVRFASCIYLDQNSVGTGADLIRRNHKSEIKIQLVTRF